jgi:hypothetical protein
MEGKRTTQRGTNKTVEGEIKSKMIKRSKVQQQNAAKERNKNTNAKTKKQKKIGKEWEEQT